MSNFNGKQYNKPKTMPQQIGLDEQRKLSIQAENLNSKKYLMDKLFVLINSGKIEVKDPNQLAEFVVEQTEKMFDTLKVESQESSIKRI